MDRMKMDFRKGTNCDSFIMKNCWTLLFLAALLQTLSVTVLAGGKGHHDGSNIASILAAGLIVQLLSKGQHGGHHHHGHHGRHGGGEIHSLLSPFSQQGYGEESRHMLSPEASGASSHWAQRAPLDIAYSQSQYREPVMESYSHPYYYHQPGMWRMN